MSASVDRGLVERLLEDETLSFREIAELAGCSDWSVRAIARKLEGDPRPMKRDISDDDGDDDDYADDGDDYADDDDDWVDGDDAPRGTVGWIVGAGIAGIILLAVWLGLRGHQPPEM